MTANRTFSSSPIGPVASAYRVDPLKAKKKGQNQALGSEYHATGFVFGDSRGTVTR